MRGAVIITACATLLAAVAFATAAMAAEVAGTTLLPVPSTTIEPGQVIGAGQIYSRRFRTTPRSLSGITTATTDVIGKAARRRLLAGRPIPASALAVPLAARRGAVAIASYEEAGLSISAPVTLLADGAAGDVITARNTATGLIIQVQVREDGGLSVAGP